MLQTKIKSAIRDVQDFPKEGILFKDITPILEDSRLCSEIIDEFVRRFDGALFISLFQFAVAGGLCLAIGFLYEPLNLQNMYNAAPDLLILGVFSTGLGYVLQAIAQAKVTSSVSARET